MGQAVQALARSDESLVRFHVGLGIHSGSTMLGTIGAANRVEATVLSDAVNLAARQEGLKRAFGVGSLISDGALSALEGPDELRPHDLGRVRVKGKRQSIIVHEVLASDDAPLQTFKRLHKARFHAARIQFQQRQLADAQRECVAIAEAASQAGVGDGRVLLYIDPCQHFLSDPPRSPGTATCNLRRSMQATRCQPAVADSRSTDPVGCQDGGSMPAPRDFPPKAPRDVRSRSAADVVR